MKIIAPDQSASCHLDGRHGDRRSLWVRQLLTRRHKHVVAVGQRNATERLAALLMAISCRNERSDVDPARIALPMTRADIADFLCLTIETVSRTFTKLRQGGFIDLVDPGLVVIRDRRKLGRLSVGDAN